MTTTDPQQGPNQPYQTTYQSAANPFSSAAMGQSPMTNSYHPYSNYSPYSPLGGYGSSMSYGGYGSPMGYSGFGNSMMGDHLYQGVLGHAAESLGRLNNLLSMTGMLVDHISNHGKLLYSKGVEFQTWYQSARHWGESHSEWMEKLGLQIESSWKTNENEEVRRRRMLVRRVRTMIIVAFFVSVFYFIRKRQRRSRQDRWESIFYHPNS